MSSNAQKTPIARSLESFAERKVLGALEMLGQQLPASVVSVNGSIVNVKFELTNVPYTLPQTTMPLIGSEYLRLPIQPGCMGFVVSADAYLGGVSGLGGGTADLSKRANLSTLVFVPIGNSGWSAPEDPNAAILYGPNGVILRDLMSKCKFVLIPGGVTMSLPASNVSMTMTAAGFEFTGPVKFNQPVTMQQTLNVVGALSAASAAITGVITAASAALTGALTALSAAITNALTGGQVSSTAGDVTASNFLRGVDMQVSGHVQYTVHEHIYNNPVTSVGETPTGTPN